MLNELLQIMISNLLVQLMSQSTMRRVIFSSTPLKKGMISINSMYSKACIVLSLQTRSKMYVEHVVSNCNFTLYETILLIEICFNSNNVALTINSWEHIVSIRQESMVN